MNNWFSMARGVVETLMATEHTKYIVLTALLVALLGAGFALATHYRVRRSARKELRLVTAGFALLSLKGLATLATAVALVAGLSEGMAGRIYRFGWQVALLWFGLCALIFALRTVRSRKGLDRYYLIPMALTALLVTGLYELTPWRVAFTDAGWFDVRLSAHAPKVILLQLLLWLWAFGYGAWRLFRRRRLVKDEKARRALTFMTGAFVLIGTAGAVPLWQLRHGDPPQTVVHLLITAVWMTVLFFALQSLYRHGRHRRI